MLLLVLLLLLLLVLIASAAAASAAAAAAAAAAVASTAALLLVLLGVNIFFLLSRNSKLSGNVPGTRKPTCAGAVASAGAPSMMHRRLTTAGIEVAPHYTTNH